MQPRRSTAISNKTALRAALGLERAAQRWQKAHPDAELPPTLQLWTGDQLAKVAVARRAALQGSLEQTSEQTPYGGPEPSRRGLQGPGLGSTQSGARERHREDLEVRFAMMNVMWKCSMADSELAGILCSVAGPQMCAIFEHMLRPSNGILIRERKWEFQSWAGAGSWTQSIQE